MLLTQILQKIRSAFYTKSETDTKLNTKANDGAVVHKSGDETIDGNKTFTSGFSVNKPSPRLQTKSTTYSSETSSSMTIGDIVFLNNSGAFSSWILDQLRDDLTKRLCFRVYPHTGGSYKGFAFDENGALYPENSNSSLGTSTNKWKDVHATTFNGNLVGNADTATTANKITLTDTNPTSVSSYQITFATSTSNNSQRVNDGLKYCTLEGTESAKGYGQLFLGNATSEGTAGNKYGNIRIYSKTRYYAAISGNASLTANRTLTVPDANGTLICTGNLTTTLGSGSGGGGLSDASIGIGSLVLGYVYVADMANAISSTKSNGFLNISGNSIRLASLTSKSSPIDWGVVTQVSYNNTTTLPGTWRFLGYDSRMEFDSNTTNIGTLGLFVRIA